MGREFIGDCPESAEDPELDDYGASLTIKYIKQACGEPPLGVDVQVTFEGSEVGNEGDEVSYPVISVVWNDFVCDYPGEYIEKCIEAFERFDNPEEIHQYWQRFFDIYMKKEKLTDPG